MGWLFLVLRSHRHGGVLLSISISILTVGVVTMGKGIGRGPVSHKKGMVPVVNSAICPVSDVLAVR